MADDIVDHIRAEFVIHPSSTHYETCWQHHEECAIAVLLDEIDRLRAELELVKVAKVQAEGVYIDALEKKKTDIKRLRTALALAVGEMSTSGEYSYLSPETLLNKFMQEAEDA